jgi:ligand-binding sensor domain-containing protein/signal transduction histidine kinase
MRGWLRIGVWSVSVLLTLTSSTYAERIPVRSYTSADGLADNHVNRIRQDSRGFIWIATDEGLSRFDGYEFVNYTTAHGLPHRWVNDLIETRHGGYWVATDGGVCRFDPAKPPSSNSAFACYSPGQSKDARRVNALAEDPSGAIWCATYDGLYRMESAEGRVTFSHPDIGIPAVYEGSLMNNLLFDRKGTLWVASRTGLYHRLSSGSWERYSRDHGLPDLFIETLLEDRGGRLWIGARSVGACLLVPEPDTTRRVVERCYSTQDGLPANDVRSLLQTQDSHLWIATVSGLSELQPSGHIVTYTTTSGLSDSTVYKLTEDRTGNLWIGTKNAGIMRLDRHGFVTYGEADGFRSGDYVSSILEVSGRLCVVSGTVNHRLVQCFDGRKFTAVELPIPSQFFWSGGAGWYQGALRGRDGSWWVPTSSGLFRFPPVRRAEDLIAAGSRIIEGTADKTVEFARQDQIGDIWIDASAHGANELLRWEHDTGKARPFAGLASLKAKMVSTMTRDSSGQLWFGFRVSGFAEDGGIVRCHDDSTSTCETIEGAPRGDIQTLYLDRAERLWVGSSQGGVARLDNLTDDHPRFATYYTTSSGLSGNEVWCITEDLWGRVYVGTNRGLDQIDPSTEALRYLTPEGLAPGRIQSAFADGAGNLWFATHQAISRLEPLPRSQSAPQVRITAIRVSGAALPFSALGETRDRHLSLAASENSIQIDFAGMDLSPGSRLRYQVLLEGASQEWSAPAETRAADFPRLPAGAYRLLVRAINAEGIISDQPASLAFTIALPVWRRWWFVFLAVVATILPGYALHRYRLGRALALEHVRARIATDLHDEIGSSLSRMAILSEVVQRQMHLTASGDSARLLGDISATARELVDVMSDIVWSIDPRRDDLRSLVTRIREFASDMLEAKGITWEFKTPAEIDDVLLSPEQRHDLYLIFKEAVTNIVRHSGCSSASLSIEISRSFLIVEIRDDGCGFESGTACGHGLTSIDTRAARIRGSCRVTSARGEGTSITIAVPL